MSKRPHSTSEREHSRLHTGIMAAVGAEVTGSWLLSSGVVSFFILLLLLSIFLTALCSDCGRHSFELRDPEVHRSPSTLISVVKLEEARENPTTDEIQNDEKQFHPNEENPVQFTPWRSHLGAPHTKQESRPEEEPSGQFTPWRSHLVAPQSQDLNSDHIYHSIGGDGTSGDMSSPPPPANRRPTRECDAAQEDFFNHDGNSVYAQVSKKLSSNTSPPLVHTCEDTQVEEKEEEEEPSPPLPKRMTEMEG
ncbi:uncharacterized protein LOC115777676 [Archocentrus centrarchus]|uniref:uncharacterized protein LOC115777676 n=1 Tax=Archocentrus centrarchus TaxID=63155 RepID=UPI0011EA0F8F|nr:uncharacterized protein LOC115777676 [Archocentrus centrarchus]